MTVSPPSVSMSRKAASSAKVGSSRQRSRAGIMAASVPASPRASASRARATASSRRPSSREATRAPARLEVVPGGDALRPELALAPGADAARQLKGAAEHATSVIRGGRACAAGDAPPWCRRPGCASSLGALVLAGSGSRRRATHAPRPDDGDSRRPLRTRPAPRPPRAPGGGTSPRRARSPRRTLVACSPPTETRSRAPRPGLPTRRARPRRLRPGPSPAGAGVPPSGASAAGAGNRRRSGPA